MLHFMSMVRESYIYNELLSIFKSSEMPEISLDTFLDIDSRPVVWLSHLRGLRTWWRPFLSRSGLACTLLDALSVVECELLVIDFHLIINKIVSSTYWDWISCSGDVLDRAKIVFWSKQFL